MWIGIDLGTTNSLVAVFRDGKAELIPNALGDFMTPSVVSEAETGDILVGLAAREGLGHKHAATAFKRWMGTEQVITLGKRSFRAEELSALILKSLKSDAENWLKQPITEAVVTVPAYFNDTQRQATKNAAELAGLKVERLLNEPTAAGLAYGLQERAELCSFLVFDLGGGTFDVSVLEYFDGVVEVRASAGDTRLGGEDFVQVLVLWFLDACASLKKLSRKEREAIVQDQRLWHSAEQAKRELSTQEQTTMQWSNQGVTHTLEIQRAEYERHCESLLARLRRPLERALSDARIEISELNEVVLVGGASRMPMVHNLITRLFEKTPLRSINPDEIIAHGAAIQAALKAHDKALEEVVLTDVMPYSLGVISSEDIAGKRYHDRFSPIIERNTPVPVSRMSTYYTISDGQSEIVLPICQGESPVGSENLQLGQMQVPIPAKPEGEVHVEVRFTYDASGLLEVEAHVPITGKTFQHIIQRDGNTMTQAQIKAALLKLQNLKIHPREQQENAWLLARAKRLYEDHLGIARQNIGTALAQFETILDRQDEYEIRHNQKAFRRFLDDFDQGFRL